VDRHERALLVVWPGEHQLEFEVAQPLRDRRDLGLDLDQRVGVVGLLREIEQQLGLVDPGLELSPRCELTAQIGKLLLDRLGALGVVPEARLSRLLL